jgi:hypothetical protein
VDSTQNFLPHTFAGSVLPKCLIFLHRLNKYRFVLYAKPVMADWIKRYWITKNIKNKIKTKPKIMSVGRISSQFSSVWYHLKGIMKWKHGGTLCGNCRKLEIIERTLQWLSLNHLCKIMSEINKTFLNREEISSHRMTFIEALEECPIFQSIFCRFPVLELLGVITKIHFSRHHSRFTESNTFASVERSDF